MDLRDRCKKNGFKIGHYFKHRWKSSQPLHDTASHNFQTLTPTICENMHTYNEAFNYIFSQDNVLNVAISGPYGAGKSSVIETYKQNNPNKSFMHLSLTHFNQSTEHVENNHTGKEEDKETPMNLRIEGQLLNQLIHQIKRKNIPQTRFKITKPLSTTVKVLHYIGISTMIGLSGYLIKFKAWQGIANNIKTQWLKDILQWSTKEEAFIGALTVLMTIIVVYVVKVVKAQLESPIFKKVVFKGYQVELFSEKEDSYFDKYLDDILYLFRNADTQVFVFEDIDRYNNNVIFSKLREINRLVNHDVEKPIRFFYLIKDNIFDSKDRTKFFDYIMPIIPVLDSSNAYNQFLKLYKHNEVIDKLDNTFLKRVCYYLDDMRLLKNIFNEFLIYMGRVEASVHKLNLNKLLAMTIYKNIFPEDFALLQLNRGYVYCMFDNIQQFIPRIIKPLNEELENLDTFIREVEEERITSIDELIAIYFMYPYQLQIGNKRDDNYTTRLEMIKDINSGKKIKFYSNGWNDTTKEVLFKTVTNNEEFKARCERVENKAEESQKRLKRRRETLEKHINNVKAYKLNQVIGCRDIKSPFDIEFNEEMKLMLTEPKQYYITMKQNIYFPLIKYLLGSGMISESYNNYQTYFIEASISKEDMIFIRSVLENQHLGYNYPLKNANDVVNELKEEDFKSIATLNIDLYSHIIECNHGKLCYAMESLSDYDDITFIVVYSQSRPMKRMVHALCEYWKTSLYSYYLRDPLESERVRIYNYFLLYSTNIHEIVNSDIKDDMCKCRGLLRSLIEDIKPSSEEISNYTLNLKKLEIKFVSIDYSVDIRDLLSKVYINYLYAINKDMIRLFLEVIYEKNNVDFSRLYTIISSKPEDSLYRYLHSDVTNLEKLVKISVDNSNLIHDDEKIALEIINHDDLSEEIKLDYIGKLNTPITYIKSINDENLWPEVMYGNKLAKNVENIIAYYNKMENWKNPESYIKYINSFKIKDFRQVDLESNVIEDTFPAYIISNEEISVEYTTSILKSTQGTIDNFDIPDVDDKIPSLIDTSIITMTSQNLVQMSNNYPDYLVPFIIKNINKYIELMDDHEMPIEEIRELYKSNLNIEYKKEIMAKLWESPADIDLVNYNAETNLCLLKQYHEDDQDYLIEVYDECDPPIKGWIVQNWIDKGWDGEIEVSKQLCLDLFENQAFTDKKDLLQWNNHLLDEETKKSKMYLELAKSSGFSQLLKDDEQLNTDDENQDKDDVS